MRIASPSLARQASVTASACLNCSCVGSSTLNYTDFQRSIGDQRTRMLVYPSVWLFDPQMKPLMQMPAGTGTFETVEEQVEILNLVQ